MKTDGHSVLGEVEQLVLLAILRLGDGAYAAPIREELRVRVGIELSRGSIYVTLDRLERKGYVSSWFDDPTPEPGGKARRCFTLERQGLEVLKATQRMIAHLEAGTVLAPGGRRKS
ncbi:MAG TPA: helix-turn-helix transcriptional regulator [Vicinamibacterales bacterium]|nr:helix-turn-helix transcriptional regulator [Vicinamibacterales bacterium]